MTEFHCAVKGCDDPNNGTPHNPKINLCEFHWNAWGWFLRGWDRAKGRQVKMGEEWHEVFDAFKSEAAINIEGMKAFATAFLQRGKK